MIVDGRYSMRKAYDNMLRFRNEKRRFKRNTESQRHLEDLYPAQQKQSKRKGSSGRTGKLPVMYTQHDTVPRST